MKEIRISIVIPVYNSEKTIRTCLHSICEQRFEHLEILCVDDGSSDRSREVIAAEAKKNPCIIYREKGHSGQGDTRNQGMVHARGKYILFVDSDDRLEKGCLEHLWTQMENTGADVLIFGFTLFQNGKKKGIAQASPFTGKKDDFMKEHFKEVYQTFLMNAPWNKLIRRTFLEEEEIRFRKDMHHYEDLMFSLEVIQKARTVTVDSALCYVYYYGNQGSLLTRYFDNIDTSIYLVADKLQEFIECYHLDKEYYYADIIHKIVVYVSLIRRTEELSKIEKLRRIYQILSDKRLKPYLLYARSDIGYLKKQIILSRMVYIVLRGYIAFLLLLGITVAVAFGYTYKQSEKMKMESPVYSEESEEADDNLSDEQIITSEEETETLRDEEIVMQSRENLTISDQKIGDTSGDFCAPFPDLYNTGAGNPVDTDGTGLEKLSLTLTEKKISVDGVQLRVSQTGIGISTDGYEDGFQIEFDNIDFAGSDYEEGINQRIFFPNDSNSGIEGTITFRNCILPLFTCLKKMNNHISLRFEDCTFTQGGYFTNTEFENCQFGSGTNPIDAFCGSNTIFKNCYFWYRSDYSGGNGKHVDGIQVCGAEEEIIQNIKIENCVFDLPALQNPLSLSNTDYINACIMIQPDYGIVDGVTIRNCILNGGGFSIYLFPKKAMIDNVFCSGLQFGCGSQFGPVYSKVTASLVWENASFLAGLQLGSIWEDGEGIHFSVSNRTNSSHTLRVVTDNDKEYTYLIEPFPSVDDNEEETFDDLPLNIVNTIEDQTVQQLDFYDNGVLIYSKKW